MCTSTTTLQNVVTPQASTRWSTIAIEMHTLVAKAVALCVWQCFIVCFFFSEACSLDVFDTDRSSERHWVKSYQCGVVYVGLLSKAL